MTLQSGVLLAVKIFYCQPQKTDRQQEMNQGNNILHLFFLITLLHIQRLKQI